MHTAKGVEIDSLRPARPPLQATAQHLRIVRLKHGGDLVPPLVTKNGDLRLRGVALSPLTARWAACAEGSGRWSVYDERHSGIFL